MIVVREPDEIVYDKKTVVTVGTFDGVHIGHQQIIGELNRLKEEKNLRSILITFDPHPQIVLRNRSKDVKLLTSTEEKLELLKRFPLDTVYIINFSKEFAATPAETFFTDYIVNRIGLNDLVIGYDHMFGKNREGSIETVNALSNNFGFSVHKVPEFKIDDKNISSTEIRNLLEQGDVNAAKFFLGRFYEIEGTVVQGAKRGRELGYPTANLKIDDDNKQIPKNGIYAVEVLYDKNIFQGMMSIGHNPTVNDTDEIFIEVNIFNFDKDIYGEKIKIRFVEYIREEVKFNSLEELTKKLDEDKQKTLNIFSNIN
ncbi:MAG: bifunctional riboflavin kinase/FAD synthetase [Bacteroidetes bacterium]|nr:bifunctional riboflavin kinase/FAD synthetase [Bacteroidota bacterium]